jgi:hypothetical protein
MTQPHVIEIEIDEDGKIHGEVKGVAGPSCSSLSAWLDTLGDVELDEKTDDFRKSPGQEVRINAR